VGELASKEQLRMSFARWALVTVPLILLLGFLMASLSNSGDQSRWYQGLIKPILTPPGWAFPVVWTTLYVMLGLALAMILDARGAKGRGAAIGLFVVQMILNLIWSPTFFAAHQVSVALIIIMLMFAFAVATTFAFARVRKTAAWLMVPYLAWLTIAFLLNLQIDLANPDAETFVPEAARTTIPL
jgi:translocator protein